MRIGIGLGIGFLGVATAGTPAIDYAAEVQAMLSGTPGFALDPTDTATMWQDAAATTAVTAASDPVWRIDTKWGTLGLNLQATNSASRPPWNGTGGLTYDGADDRMLVDGSISLGRNAPALFITARVNFANLVTRAVFQVSTASSANLRLGFRALTTGAIEVLSRRLDGDTQTVVTSATGVLSTSTGYTISVLADFAGAGEITVWVDGVEVASGAISGTAGNTSDTGTARIQSGSFGAGGSLMNGTIGKVVVADFLPTSEQIGLMEGWAELGSP